MIPKFLKDGSRLIVFALTCSLVSSCAKDYFGDGRAQQQAGHLKAAIDNYSKAISADPNDSNAYKYSGGAYQELGEHQKAIDDFTKALKLDPKSDWYRGESVHFYRALSWYNLGNIDQAINDFTADIDHCISHSLNAMDAYGERGFCYAKQGDYQKAIDDLNIAINLTQTNASYYQNRAWCYNKLKQYQKAVSDCTKAISLDPLDTVDEKFCPKLSPNGAHVQRAEAYEKLGNKDLAAKDNASAAHVKHARK